MTEITETDVDPAPGSGPSGPPSPPGAGERRTGDPDLSETTWVSRAQDGDPIAFEHLVRAYEA